MPNTMNLQQIRPDFSGSAATMQGAQRSMQGVGALSNEWLDRLAKEKAVATEQARYETEQKRLGVLDERATQLWNEQQKEKENMLAMKTAVGQGLLGVPEDALTTAQQVQPPQQQRVQVSPQEQYLSQGSGGAISVTPGRNVVTTTPGEYMNPNPDIVFNKSELVTRNEQLPSKSKLSQVVEGILPMSGLGNVAKVVNAITPDPARAKLLETPGMYTTVPGSSVRNLSKAGEEALKKGSISTTERKVTSATTKLNDIDLNNLYDTKGKLIPPGKMSTVGSVESGKLYYKNREGLLVNAADVAKAKDTRLASYVKGKSETTYKPGSQSYTKYISGTNNKEFIANNGTTVPVKSVVDSVQGSMTSYQDVIDKMGKGTTAEKITKISNDITKDVLKAHPELAHMAIDIQEMAKKGVGLKLPDGSLTKTEEMKLIAAGEDLKHQYDVQKENRGYDQAWRLQKSSQGFQAGQNALTRAAAKENSIREATAKEPTVQMYKTEGGMLVEQKVPASMLKQAVDSGFKMGSARQLRQESSLKDSTGGSKVDLTTLGGGANLFGTSGLDLVTLSKRMKSLYPKVPQPTIDAEVANLSQGWVSDAVDINKLKANLSQY